MDNTEQLLSARRVCERYGVVGRTLERWLHDPRLEFPTPVTINRRRYFRVDQLQTWERARVARRAGITGK
jgi:hypothetical protein